MARRVYLSAFALLLLGFLAVYFFLEQRSVGEMHQRQIKATIENHIQTVASAETPVAEQANSELTDTPRYKTQSFEQDLEAWQKSLADSHYPHDQLIAYYLSRDKEQKALYLLQAYGLDPNDVMINLEVLRFCRKQQNPSLCDLPYMALLQKKEAENAFFQMELAAYAFVDGDRQGALKLLSQAAAKTQGDFHDWRYVEMIDQSFQRFGIERELQSVNTAVGYMAAKAWPPYMSDVVRKLCTPETFADDALFRSGCGDAARRLSELTGDQASLAVWNKIRSQAEGLDRKQTNEQWKAYADKHLIPQFQQTQELEAQLAKLMFQKAGIDTAALAQQLAEEHGVEPELAERFINQTIYEEGASIPIPDEVWAEYLQLLPTAGSTAFNRILVFLIEQQQ